MLRHRSASLLAGLAGLSLFALGAARAQEASVGENVLISNPRLINAGADVRIDPSNPDRILAGANTINDTNVSIFSSTDGGLTWAQTFLPRMNAQGDTRQSIATVEWGRNGRPLATTIGFAPLRRNGQVVGEQQRVRTYVNSGSGQSGWFFSTTASGTQVKTDNQQSWVDHSETSTSRGNFYVCWRDGNAAFVNRLVPGSGGWAKPRQVSGGESSGSTAGCDVKSNARGAVFVFWPSAGNRLLFVSKSADGGATWSLARGITNTFGAERIGIPAMARRRAPIYSAAAVYQSATKTLAYLVWTDLSGEVGCRTPDAEPGRNAASACKTRIWLARSSDGGAGWQVPRKIHDGAARNDQFNPALAVDETTGVIGVIYYDTVEDPARVKTHLYFQSSSDDGATWSDPVRVTDAPSDETPRAHGNAYQYGDRTGLSAFGGKFVAVWTDHRAGVVNEQIRAAVIEP